MSLKAKDERATHLRDYWQLAWRGKWLVLAIAVVVATLVAVATFLQAPVYRATASLEIQPKAKSISPTADFSGLGTSSWSWAGEERYLNTQMQIIRSRKIGKAVLAHLDLQNHPRFADMDDPAGVLARRIQLEILLDTYVMHVSIEDTDPQLAALLVNAVAEAYVAANREAAISNALDVIHELEDQVAPLKEKIAAAENQRMAAARQNAFYVPESQETSGGNRLAQLQEELTEVQIARGERAAILEEIETIEQSSGSYQALPLVANDPRIQELNDTAVRLERQLQELSLSYRAGHPKYLAARKALDEIQNKIEEQTEKVIEEIKTQDVIDQRRESDLENRLLRARGESLDLAHTSGEIAIFDAEIREDRRIYELISSRMKEISLNQETLMNNVRVLEESIVPKKPVRPRKALNLGAGVLLGLLLGGGVVFFIDYLDNTIKNAEDIEQYLSLPLLAVVPRQKKAGNPTYKEAFQTLRTGILFGSKGRTLKTLLITSAGPGEGKSTVASNLARTLASAGDRVALVDCDLRRPAIHDQLGLARAGGLTNYLVSSAGGTTWLRYFKDIPGVNNLKVLTSGPLPPNPAELFGSDRFLELLKELREHFNWVLIDSPPVVSMSDSIILGSLTDMTILVIKQNANDRELILRSTVELGKVDAHVVGAVLNNVDLERAGYYGYHYAGYTYSREDEADHDPTVDGQLARREKSS